MTDRYSNEELLSDISLLDAELSYAFVGCARWGETNWYDGRPKEIEGEGLALSFAKSIYKFSVDFDQGQPILLSSLTRPIFEEHPEDEIDLESDDSEEGRELLLKSDFYIDLLEKGVLSEINSMDWPEETPRNFRRFEGLDIGVLEQVLRLHINLPDLNFIFGKAFFVFKDFVIEITWNGWAVYARAGADIGFVQWFFSLINYVLGLNPALLNASRHPLLDDYNPLENG